MKILKFLTILQIFITFLIINTTESAAINLKKSKAAPSILSLYCEPGYDKGPLGKRCRKIVEQKLSIRKN